jgi:hypothetical protein
MVCFDNIPYVYELARIHKKCETVVKFCMKYDEYTKYSDMFDALSREEQESIMEKAKARRKTTR